MTSSEHSSSVPASKQPSNITRDEQNKLNNIRFDNFFALFDLPVQFDIDNAQLQQRMKALQQQYHPDNLNTVNDAQTNLNNEDPNLHSNKNDVEYNADSVNGVDSLNGEVSSADNISASNTDKASALINHAYQILRYPDSRASYMLEMQNQDAELNNSIADLEFLENAMSLRIELDETQSIATLHKLTDSVNSLLDNYTATFKQAYDQTQWADAIAATQKLKFLVKLNKDIAAKIDSLHQQSDDEDDLYV